jgi:hypothetical protein
MLRGLFVIRVEDAVAIEKQVDRLGDADAALGGGPVEALLEIFRIVRIPTKSPRQSGMMSPSVPR